MEEEQSNYFPPAQGDLNLKIRDLEEKQKILKDRLLMIGENLVEIKENTDEKILEIKKEIDTMKQNMERLISFLEMASTELSRCAKKQDLDVLAKQAKMFQPLELVTKKDLEKMKK